MGRLRQGSNYRSLTTLTVGKFVSKLKVYAKVRTQEISQGGESAPSVYPFAMDTSGSFCDTAILFLKKIALVKFSNEPGS